MKRRHTRQSVMSVEEMDTIPASSCENNVKQVLKSNEATHFRNCFHSDKILEGLQSLSKNEVLCDIRFETDDGCITFGNKIVLMAASPYFSAMFSNFDERNKDLVNIRELDSTILQLLVNYIYTGEIMVTKENVQVLLPAADVWQLDYVKGVCAEFLQKQLNPSNCLIIRAFADLHNCTDLLSISEAYIKQNCLEVAKGEDFLSLYTEDLVKLISSNDLAVPFEEKMLLPTANILQLDFVSAACAEFLQKQLDASNCLGIRAFADLHNCAELISSSEAFIRQHFLEVVKSVEFLSLSSEDVVKIISCNDLAVPYEENVFESVIKWVKQDLDQRKYCLTELMEHVRLPLIAFRPDILLDIVNEPLLKNNLECNDFVIEAYRFTLQKTLQYFTIPQTIRCKPRQFGDSHKVILMFNRSYTSPKCYTEWYDPATKLREKAPGLKDRRQTAGLGVIGDQFVFAVGGVNNSCSQSVSMLDVSLHSPSWVPMAEMVVKREQLGVGILDGNLLYAVGGGDERNPLNSVEVFDVSIQKWRLVASMTTGRFDLGVGVLNNCLYAVGGAGNGKCLKSVEYYDPTHDTWTPVADMSACRQGVGVVVLDNRLYAIGGYGNKKDLKSVEVYSPSDGVWSSVADMEICRFRPGAVAINGLLYVMGGESADESINDTLEIYNPNTNTWTTERLSRNEAQIYGGVVVDRPPNFTD